MHGHYIHTKKKATIVRGETCVENESNAVNGVFKLGCGHALERSNYARVGVALSTRFYIKQ